MEWCLLRTSAGSGMGWGGEWLVMNTGFHYGVMKKILNLDCVKLAKHWEYNEKH